MGNESILSVILAGSFAIAGTLLGTALGMWGSYKLERKKRQEERDQVSYTFFAGLQAAEQYLVNLLGDEYLDAPTKVDRLGSVSFYWQVFEQNLGNLGTLGPGEATMLCSVYADLKVIHESSRSIADFTNPNLTMPTPKMTDEILEKTSEVLDEIGLLIGVMAQQRGWETLTEEDLRSLGVKFPSGNGDGDEPPADSSSERPS